MLFSKFDIEYDVLKLTDWGWCLPECSAPDGKYFSFKNLLNLYQLKKLG